MATYMFPYLGQACIHPMTHPRRLLLTGCFSMAASMQVPPVWKTLQIQSCSSGQVTTNTNDTCRACGAATFSLNPQNTSCDPCPSEAMCSGSDAFIPPLNHWHSSPNSTTVLSCPNTAGCAGNRTQLLACKQVSTKYSTTHLASSL